MPCFCGQKEKRFTWVKSSWPSDVIAFVAKEITSLVRGPDFDPYESRERWDPLAIHSGIWKMWWFWWDVSLKKTKPQLKVNRWWNTRWRKMTYVTKTDGANRSQPQQSWSIDVRNSWNMSKDHEYTAKVQLSDANTLQLAVVDCRRKGWWLETS